MNKAYLTGIHSTGYSKKTERLLESRAVKDEMSVYQLKPGLDLYKATTAMGKPTGQVEMVGTFQGFEYIKDQAGAQRTVLKIERKIGEEWKTMHLPLDHLQRNIGEAIFQDKSKALEYANNAKRAFSFDESWGEAVNSLKHGKFDMTGEIMLLAENEPLKAKIETSISQLKLTEKLDHSHNMEMGM